tara:strand:- start:564 stop:803 length:240 start_codon:yes stop_codon:yes gene_type:complete
MSRGDNFNVRKVWGTDEQYYKELEAFYEKHKDAHIITVDPENDCPVEAVYKFLPHLCLIERKELLSKLSEVERSEDKRE